MSAPPKLFILDKNLLAEMANFQLLMKNDADKGKELLTLGEAVMQNAEQGQLRKFIAAALELSRSPEAPLFYYLTKALIGALKKGHLMVASFILDNGFNLHDPHLPHILNFVIKDNAVTDNVALIAVQFLQRYKYDVNLQEKETYWAPIHYAVQRSFLRTIESLIASGADVNIVADKDIMPLNIALELLTRPFPDSVHNLATTVQTLVIDESSDAKEKKLESNGKSGMTTRKETLDEEAPEVTLARTIVELLQKNGAKETWRRGITVTSLPQNESYSAIGAPRESCNISTAASSSTNNSTTSVVKPPNNKVSFSGNMIAANANSANDSSKPKNNMVRFSGGGSNVFSTSITDTNPLPPTPPSQTSLSNFPHENLGSDNSTDMCNSNSIGKINLSTVNKEEIAVGIHLTAGSVSGSEGDGTLKAEVFLGESDDGNAFLFSTGN